MLQSKLDWALHYADLGFQVVPIRSRGKYPITPNGFYDASSNRDVVEAWFNGNEDLEIGIRIPEDIVILDVDDLKMEKVMEEMGFAIEPTLLCKSGGSGHHYWYRLPASGVANKERKIKMLPDVDLLVHGVVLVPPSMHESGRQYEWHGEFDPWMMAEAPLWILNYYQKNQRNPVDPDKILNGVQEGERNVELFRYACYLVGKGNKPREIKILLKEAASSCSPPYDENHAVYIAERAYKLYAKKEEPKAIKIYTLADLAAAKFPPPKFLLYDSKGGIIQIGGYTLLSSEPKKGKSAIASEMAFAISEGRKLWDRFDTIQCGVLYLDLEQSDEFAEVRWREITEGRFSSSLSTAFDWPGYEDGALDHLRTFLLENPHINLAIIDTLADMWPDEKEMSGNAYHREQRIVKPILSLCKDLRIAIILIHHDRKDAGGDMIKRASGSYALTGKASTVMSFQRPHGEDRGKILITGKNIPERVIGVKKTGKVKWEFEFEKEN